MIDQPELHGEPEEPAPSGAAPEDMPVYEVQLAGVRVWEVTAARPEVAESSSHEPAVEAIRAASGVARDRSALWVRWRTVVRYPYSHARFISIDATVEGRFSVKGEISRRRLQKFMEREAFVLLWPYLRATVAQIAAMLDVKVPPLPTLDVRKVVGAPRPSQAAPRRP